MANRKNFTDTFISSLQVDRRTEIYDDSKATSGLVLRVTPTGHKSFALRYWFHGQSKQYTIGKYGTWKLADARKEAKRLKHLIDQGIDPKQKKEEQKQVRFLTFSEVLERYKSDKMPDLKQSTRIDRTRRLNTIEKGLGAKRYIKDIKRGEVISFLDSVKRRAPVNAQKLQVALSAVFRFAKDREWVKDNIASRIRIEVPDDHTTEWENIAYTDDEIKTLWHFFSEHSEPVGSFFQFLLVTGKRSGETRLAKWEHIDFQNQLWRIPKQNIKRDKKSIKATEDDFVPLSPLALEILERLRPWTDQYVFESMKQRGQPISHPSKAAQRIKKKSGVDFNCHSLRTTFSTRQAEQGTPPQVLEKLLNHKKGAGSAVTALYNKYDYANEKRMAIQKWDRYLRTIIAGETSKVAGRIGNG